MYLTSPLLILLSNVYITECVRTENVSVNPLRFLLNIKFKTVGVDKSLIGFHMDDCDYCKEMNKLLQQLEDEEGIKVNVFSVNKPKNFKFLKRLDNGKCGGLPFYFNTRTSRYICGSTNYENLHIWATDGINKTHMPPRNMEINEHKKYRSLGMMSKFLRCLRESLDR